MIDHLIFDTTNATTVADTHSVGAYVRSGKSGALITHHALFKLPVSPFSFVDADVTPVNDTITEVAHGFRTGDLIRLTTTGVLPAGLALLTDYYVIRVDADTIKLASSASNAEWNLPVDITAAAGGGTHTLTGQTQDTRALDVFANLADGEGNKITSTGGALNVNLSTPLTVDTKVDGIYAAATNIDPDNVGLIAHTRAATLADTDQIQRSTAATADQDNVVAANVHGLDVNSFGMMLDGSSWDRMTGTGGNLNVNIAASSTVTVTDAALATSSIASAAETLDVANTAQNAVLAPLAARKYLWIYNNDNQKMYVGQSGVTSGSGFPIAPGSYMEMRAGTAIDIEYVSSKINHEIRTLELS